jgi:DNA-binding transcriptional ArsR family regulator
MTLGLPQPTISKHLGVLRAVGIVSVTKQGQSRVYEMNHEQLRPVYDWVKTFERHWERQLERIRARAERRALPQ